MQRRIGGSNYPVYKCPNSGQKTMVISMYLRNRNFEGTLKFHSNVSKRSS